MQRTHNITKELVRELIYYSQKKIRYMDRELMLNLKKVIKIKQIVIVTGVRRCGKSVLLRTLANQLSKPKNVLYLNFEDERLSNLTTKELDQILSYFEEINLPKGRIFYFLDEIQNIKNWEKWLTRKYEQEGKDIKFFISGSNASMLSSELSTALTGRNVTFTLFPFSFKEFLNSKKIIIPKDRTNITYQKISSKIKHLLADYLLNGGFPEIAESNSEEIKQKILQSYFTDIIHRDILFRHNIKDVKYFENFAKYFMTNFTNEFSFNNLTKSFEYGINTIIRYISHLEQSFLINQIPLFTYSLKKQQINRKKIYCIDNGLRNSVSFKFSKDEGKLAENLVFLELKRKGNEIYYWKNRGEVDFIVKNQNLTAINVSYTNEINEREKKSLLEFKEKLGKRVKKLIIITEDKEGKEKIKGKTIQYIPLWKWLLQ